MLYFLGNRLLKNSINDLLIGFLGFMEEILKCGLQLLMSWCHSIGGRQACCMGIL